ncbi:beta-1,3-glucanase domain-containing protein [Sarocladium implicatum]|nr:beta-1,3-glucanase domain-containing protein [Sarocladium implicatum]
MAPESLAIEIRNNTSSPHLFASITGTSPSSGLFLLSSDGSTPYHPASPSSPLTPPAVDVGIPIGGPGESRTLTIPRLAGARIWLCKRQNASDGGLKFFINPGPALVEPSATNVSDENYGVDWGFAEFTLNEAQLYVNVSYVDFVSLPVSLGVASKGKDGMRTVPGLPGDGLGSVAAGLEKQGGGWEKLVIRRNDGEGDVLRVLSPNSGGVLFPGLWDGYYDSYLDKVWDKYSGEDLTVNTQFTWGDVKGRVKDGKLTFKGAESSYAFSKPSAPDIFSCSTGPFAHTPEATEEQLNVGARLAAALNRSTLLSNSNQPEGEEIAKYYKESTTNHYARVCHEVTVGGRGYAFPYDDVGPSGRGEDEDQSGFLNDGDPEKLVISVGKPL